MFKSVSRVSANFICFSQFHMFQPVSTASASFVHFSQFYMFQPVSGSFTCFSHFRMFQPVSYVLVSFVCFILFRVFQPVSCVSANLMFQSVSYISASFMFRTVSYVSAGLLVFVTASLAESWLSPALLLHCEEASARCHTWSWSLSGAQCRNEAGAVTSDTQLEVEMFRHTLETIRNLNTSRCSY